MCRGLKFAKDVKRMARLATPPLLPHAPSLGNPPFICSWACDQNTLVESTAFQTRISLVNCWAQADSTKVQGRVYASRICAVDSSIDPFYSQSSLHTRFLVLFFVGQPCRDSTMPPAWYSHQASHPFSRFLVETNFSVSATSRQESV